MKTFRSDCPISCSLELIGDKWTLLIMRDILLLKKRTFKALASSDEGIATNILSNRLSRLEEHNILSKTKSPNNKKTNIYAPTDLGLDLIPIVLELALWSGLNKTQINPNIPDENILGAKAYQQDRKGIIEQIRKQFTNN